MTGLQEEIQFEVLRHLHQICQASQRTLAKDVGMGSGTSISDFWPWLKRVWSGRNFSQSKNMLRDAYLPTSSAVPEKYKLKKVEFLKRK
ncbi:MAG: hypothetical protein ING36_01575 [Burkholderiales bacterium]|jgi:hypothetical protein|nr:hypothetical protein [Burkholderiales bacterium]